MNTNRTALTKSSLAVFLLAGAALGQNINWDNPAGGNWNVASNWSPATIPNMTTQTAVFNIGGAYTTTLNVSTPSLGSLNILDTNCTLGSNSGNSMGVIGGVVNNGLILINNTNGGFSSSLNFDASAALTGTGVLTLNGSGSRSNLNATAGNTITHGVDHTINGIGRITGDFINDGTISASTTNNTLALLSGTWINNNLIEVSNGSIMTMTSLVIGQGPSGEISVVDGQLNLSNTSIADGTIRTMPGFNWTGTASIITLNNVNLIGEGRTNSGVILNAINEIQNDGTLVINSTNGGFSSTLEFQNTFSLNGSGDILMNGSGSRSLLRSLDPAQQVTQASTHTIHGMGSIQAPIVNNGEIASDVAGQTLTFSVNNQVNNNVYRVTNDSTMTLNTIALDQSGGGNIAIDNGLLTLLNTTISGGSLTAGTGFARLDAGVSTFNQVVNLAPITINSGVSLSVANGLVNNSTVIVNGTNGGFASAVLFTDSTTLSGTGNLLLNGSGSRAQLNTGDGQTMTIASGHTVNGFGNINASLINNGTITSDVTGQSLFMITEDKVNNAQIQIENGSNLTIDSITITQDPSAMVLIDDGTLTLSNATIVNGTINENSGVINQVGGVSNFDNLTLNAPLNANSGTSIAVTNDLRNNNTFIVNTTNGGFASALLFKDSSTLEGTGTTRLNGLASRSQLNTDPGQTMTISGSHTVQGLGQINASLINEGVIDSDQGTLTLQTENKVNNALISVQPGMTLAISGIEINQNGGGQILNNDGLVTLSSSTIKGGTMDALSGGSTTVAASSVFEDMTNLSPANINSGVQLRVNGTVTNHSTITVNTNSGGFASSIDSTAPATIDGIGDVILNGSGTRSQLTGAGLTLGADQTLSGNGQINAPLNLEGTLAPGFSVGEIDASAPITLSDSSVFEVEVADFGSHDAINSTSTFHADGTLDLTLIDGFDPEVSWVATIVTTAAGGVTGTFDTIIAPPTSDPRLTYKIGYFDNEIRVGAVCSTDFDFSGGLNFLDVSLYLSLYSAMDPLADITGEGQFNFLDISAFLQGYGQSCP